MSIETKFRILLGYLLVMRWAIAWIFRAPLHDDRGAYLCDRNTVVGRRAAWLLFIIPTCLMIFVPPWAMSSIEFPNVLRWLATIPAATAIGLLGWSLYLASRYPDYAAEHDPPLVRLLRTTPFRLFRHPIECADAVLMICLIIISGSVAIFIAGLLAIAIMFLTVTARREIVLAQLLGDRIQESERLTNASRVLPKAKAAQYQVPTQFNLTAIIALLTILSLLFGALNYANAYFQVHPIVYLFVAGQIVAICLGQMFFHSAPRVISVIVGAVLLPTFVAVTLEMNQVNLGGDLWFVIVFCAVFGALTGYCVGTLAAGFFLITDWLEGWLVRNRDNRAVGTGKKSVEP